MQVMQAIQKNAIMQTCKKKYLKGDLSGPKWA